MILIWRHDEEDVDARMAASSYASIVDDKERKHQGMRPEDNDLLGAKMPWPHVT
jgi:hypothetical protein